MTLQEAKENIGREVRYVPYADCPECIIERGIIKSVGNKYVFVNFAPRTMGRGEACRPEDLKF